MDTVIDRLERAMPDLAQIGVGMLVLFACAACGWINMGGDDTTRTTLQGAQDATASEVPSEVAF